MIKPNLNQVIIKHIKTIRGEIKRIQSLSQSIKLAEEIESEMNHQKDN